MLRLLRLKLKLPWCCLCDFNELLQVQDKQEGPPRAHNHMQTFRDTLNTCGFVDLGYSELDFTWHGCRDGELI